jgi:DNA-binding GntR family transcriptional regulator
MEMADLSFTPIIQPLLSAQVLQELRRQILHGFFPPLQPLRETQLASALGVSRVPIREALIQLHADNLVLPSHPRGSLSPRTFSAADAHQIADARRQLEGRAGALAASHRTHADLDALRENIAAFAAADSPEELARLDVDFHALICSASHQPWLLIAWTALRWPFHALLVQGFRKYVAATSLDESKSSTADHSRIVDAIERGASDETETLLRQHIARWEEWLATF